MSDLIEIQLSAEIADESIDKMRNQLEQLGKSDSKIKPDIDITTMKSKMDEIEKKSGKMKMEVDTSKAESSLKKMESSADKLRTTTVQTFEDGKGAITGFSTTLQDANKNMKEVETFAKNSEGQFESLGKTITNNVEKPLTDMGKAFEANLNLDNATKDITGKLQALGKEFGDLVKPEDVARVEGMMKALDPSDKIYPDKVKEMNIELGRVRDTAKGLLDDQKYMDKQFDQALSMDKKRTEEMNKQHELGIRMNKEFDQNLLEKQKPQTIAPEKLAGDAQRAGRNLVALAAPILAIGGAAVKASINFESAFAGVRKTVEATESEFAILSDGMREMSKVMPQSAADIAGVSEIAGQ